MYGREGDPWSDFPCFPRFEGYVITVALWDAN